MAKRVVQVEQIFRDIEDMCFLRTGEGMKSVMKTELTVVEAIMQASNSTEKALTAVKWSDYYVVGRTWQAPARCYSLVN